MEAQLCRVAKDIGFGQAGQAAAAGRRTTGSSLTGTVLSNVILARTGRHQIAATVDQIGWRLLPLSTPIVLAGSRAEAGWRDCSKGSSPSPT